MFLTLKISIKDITPMIWRRMVVSDQLTLQQLHHLIQVAFNWSGSHLYEFFIHDYQIGADLNFEGAGKNQLNVSETTLKEFPLEEKQEMKYIYDFGDYWQHDISIEAISDLGPEEPLCLAGERNTPPEDSMGVPGYQALIKGLEDGTLDPDQRDWLGDYDPEDFDLDETNDILSDPDVMNPDYF